jgi:hypothetical protein
MRQSKGLSSFQMVSDSRDLSQSKKSGPSVKGT